MQYLLLFFEGTLTFISPCILPMLPIYLAYFSGSADQTKERQHILKEALLFVLGFSIIFVILGLFVSSVGRLFIIYRQWINGFAGVILILLGIDFLRHSPIMSKLQSTREWSLPWSNGLTLGVVFALSWSPCVGTFLASALALVVQSHSYFYAARLLIAYCLGLGIPFVISALLVDELNHVFNFLKRHHRKIQLFSGCFLIIMGILTMMGYLETWLISLT